MPIIALPIYLFGIYRNSKELLSAALLICVFCGPLAYLAHETGEGAEIILKNYPGISRELIENHEDTSLYALIIMGMMLKSHKYRNLVQLATASGKSFILGIMATYLNKKFN